MLGLDEVITSLEIGLIYGIVAIGIYITFRIIDFQDLTCDGSFVLGAAVSSAFVQAGCNSWLAIVFSGLAGCIAGMITGILYTRFKIPDLLAGILVTFMLYSINLHIMGNSPNIMLMNAQVIFEQTNVLALLSIICVTICVFLGCMLATDFGLALRSIAQNKLLARSSGINISAMIIIGLILSNCFVALGGALFSQHQGFADIGSGVGTVIVGLASVIIGEKILPYRSISLQIISCIVGSIIYRLLIAIALHSDALGLQAQDLNLVTGILVLVIMCISKKQVC